MTIKEEVEFLCKNAKEASFSIALADTEQKNKTYVLYGGHKNETFYRITVMRSNAVCWLFI